MSRHYYLYLSTKKKLASYERKTSKRIAENPDFLSLCSATCQSSPLLLIGLGFKCPKNLKKCP